MSQYITWHIVHSQALKNQRVEKREKGECPEGGQGEISPGAWNDSTLYVAGGNTTINGSSCQVYRQLPATLWQVTGWWLLVLDYRLAPEHPFPQQWKMQQLVVANFLFAQKLQISAPWTRQS